ncbi:MAG TPA: 30S ribosomal protein S15 [Verrucomicrobiae bacterium]|jgi:small subunit ribosomal protein S15|nr:30S ribosomal protein S15 [Verrucomicrobiae bacterium]
MALTKENKKKVVTKYQKSKTDTGSAEVQIALLTERINSLEQHFTANAKDHHSRYGLIKMVSRRKKLLTYVRNENPERYKDIITRLELRK